jgi:8-oxo-dGTP diphosphatase
MKRSLVRSLALAILRPYWKLFRPKTFGVKVIVRHPQAATSAIALIRNTYGRTDVWTLPGGGYRPTRETPEVAAAREVKEELGLHVSDLKVVGKYETAAEGKRDTVAFVRCTAQSDLLQTSGEVAEAVWCTPSELGRSYRVLDVTLRAVRNANDG